MHALPLTQAFSENEKAFNSLLNLSNIVIHAELVVKFIELVAAAFAHDAHMT